MTTDVRLKDTAAAIPSGVSGGRFAASVGAAGVDAPTPDAHPNQSELWIPEWRRADAEARIAKANARLDLADRRAKAKGLPGIEERFEFTWADSEVRDVAVEGQRNIKVEYCQLLMSTPSISYNGWEFIGSLDALSDTGDMLARTKPGVDLAGWKPEAQRCDHCGQFRDRTITYMVRNEDGEILQVGSSCIESFLGVRPKGLWTLDFDPCAGCDDIDDDFGSSGAVQRQLEDTRLVIAAALVATDMGRNYKPSSFDEQSTKFAVSDILFGHGGTAEKRQERDRLLGQALALRDSKSVDDVLAAVENMPRKGSGDDKFVDDVQMLCAQECTKARHLGWVVYTPKLLVNAQEQQARDSALPATVTGYLAPAGAAIAELRTSDGRQGVAATVERCMHVDGYQTYRGQKTDTILIMRAEDGHALYWKASNKALELNPGDQILLTGGTVRANRAYTDRTGAVTDQTVLERVRFETPQQSAAAAALPAWRSAIPERKRDLPVVAAFDAVTTEAELQAVVRAASSYGISKKALDAAVKATRQQFGTRTPTEQARTAYLQSSTGFDQWRLGIRHSHVPYQLNRHVAEATRAHRAGELPDDAYRTLMTEALGKRAETDANQRANDENHRQFEAQRATYLASHPEVAAERAEKERRDSELRAASEAKRAAERAAMSPDMQEYHRRLDAEQAERAAEWAANEEVTRQQVQADADEAANAFAAFR